MPATVKLFAALCATGLCVPPAQAGFFSNPQPVVTQLSGQTVLRMELNGYANYGQADAAADVAYRGDSHTWVFTLPPYVQPASLNGAFFRAAMVIDDHYSVDPLRYSFSASTGGTPVFSGAADMAHGGPFDSVFTNWVVRDYTLAGAPGSPLSFSLSNTSSTAAFDWIAVDWIELHMPTSAVPEPSAAWLLGLGGVGLWLSHVRLGFSRRRSTWSRSGQAVAAMVVAVTCISQPALAAATRDDITREALLKAYTRQDAERRYNATSPLTDGASRPVGQALADGLSGLAANAQRRMDESNALYDRFWFALENGLDIPLKTQGELDALKSLLRDNTEGTGKAYNIHARRRHAELALHLRPQSEHVFPTRNHQEAARLARLNAYSMAEFHPWSALTLAKLHLAGRGVAQDEGEARYLVDLCINAGPAVFKNTWADTVGCHVLDAQMHRNGWGGPVDEDAAQATLQRARQKMPVGVNRSLNDDALMAVYR